MLPCTTMRWQLYGKSQTSVMMINEKTLTILQDTEKEKRMIMLTCFWLVSIVAQMKLKGTILEESPYHQSMKFFFSEVGQESRKNIMNGSLKEQPNVGNKSSALVAQGGNMINDKKKKPLCGHSKKFKHTKQTCSKIHAKSLGRKKKPESALQTMAEDSSEIQISSTQLPFTKDQTERLLKITSVHSSFHFNFFFKIFLFFCPKW